MNVIIFKERRKSTLTVEGEIQDVRSKKRKITRGVQKLGISHNLKRN